MINGSRQYQSENYNISQFYPIYNSSSSNNSRAKHNFWHCASQSSRTIKNIFGTFTKSVAYKKSSKADYDEAFY